MLEKRKGLAQETCEYRSPHDNVAMTYLFWPSTGFKHCKGLFLLLFEGNERRSSEELRASPAFRAISIRRINNDIIDGGATVRLVHRRFVRIADVPVLSPCLGLSVFGEKPGELSVCLRHLLIRAWKTRPSSAHQSSQKCLKVYRTFFDNDAPTQTDDHIRLLHKGEGVGAKKPCFRREQTIRTENVVEQMTRDVRTKETS
jgi:hypothetical protein